MIDNDYESCKKTLSDKKKKLNALKEELISGKFGYYDVDEDLKLNQKRIDDIEELYRNVTIKLTDATKKELEEIKIWWKCEFDKIDC